MLKILIIANDVGNSVIKWNEDNCGVINGLPQKLRDKVMQQVVTLHDRRVSIVEYEEHHFVLARDMQNYTGIPYPEFLKDISTTILIETIQLLYWYVAPHLRARDPDLLGTTLICCECGLTQRKGSGHHAYCEFVGCPSHAKWAQVIDGYECPKLFRDDGLANVVQKFLNNKQQSSTESPQADDANKWIQKG